MIELACACATSRRLARVLTQLYDSHLRGSGIETPQFALLITLEAAQLSQVELGRIHALDKTTVSRNLAVLERNGWIERTAGADKRKRLFKLTAAGQKRLELAKPAWEKAQAQLLSAMTAGQWESMFGVLRAATEAAVAKSA